MWLFVRFVVTIAVAFTFHVIPTPRRVATVVCAMDQGNKPETSTKSTSVDAPPEIANKPSEAIMYVKYEPGTKGAISMPPSKEDPLDDGQYSSK